MCDALRCDVLSSDDVINARKWGKLRLIAVREEREGEGRGKGKGKEREGEGRGKERERVNIILRPEAQNICDH